MKNTNARIVFAGLVSAVVVSSFGAFAADIGGASEQLARQHQDRRQTPGGPGGKSGGPPSPDALMHNMDEDDDGQISRTEFRGPPQAFKKFDANGDGYVTKAELEAVLSKIKSGGRPGGGAQNPLAAWYAKLPVILTHTHVFPDVERGKNARDDWEGAVRNALKANKENNIRLSILMPTPTPANSQQRRNLEELAYYSKKYPDNFRFAAGGSSLNGWIGAIRPKNVDDGDRRKFIVQAEEIIAKGAIGFGETTALHFSFFEGHPFQEVRPDHPLFLLLADLSAKHNVPLDFHMEPVAEKWTVSDSLHLRSKANPNWVDANIAAFERLLAHNPKAKIIWVHLGMDNTGYRTPALTRRMLRTYPNLYLSITGGWPKARNNPLAVVGSGFNLEWREVFIEFSDRIMIGSDNFYQPDQSFRQMPQFMKQAAMVVRKPFLPPAVARKIAFENAQRVFRLNVLSAEDYPLPGGAGRQMGKKMGGPKTKKGGPGQKKVRNMDRDGDGRVAPSEFSGNKKKFRKIDSDHDGYLTAVEFTNFLRKTGKIGGASAARQQPAAAPVSTAPAAMIGPKGRTAQQTIKKSDLDGDGKLSRSEYRGKPQAFPRIDKDGDGVLTAKEFEARWRFLKAKRGG